MDTPSHADETLDALLLQREHEDARTIELLRRLKADGRERSSLVDQLADQLERNLEERQTAEEELRAMTTRLEATNAELREQRRRDRELFEHAPVAYLLTDGNGVIRDCNHLAGRWLGADPTRLTGRPLVSYVDHRDRATLRAWIAAFERGGEIDGATLRIRSRDGATQVARAAVSVTRAADGTVRSLRWVLVAARLDRADDAGPARVRATLPLRVAIMHRDDLYVHGLRALLTASLGVDVQVTTAADPGDVDELVDARPDVLLLEIVDDGLGALQAVRQAHPDLTVLACVRDDRQTQLAALAAGADSVVSSSTTPNELLGPLLATAQRWVTMPRHIADRVLGHALLQQRALQHLDDAQRHLLRRLTEGATIAELAGELNLSQRTVKRRLSDLYRVLDVENRAAAIALAGPIAHDAPASDGHRPRTRTVLVPVGRLIEPSSD